MIDAETAEKVFENGKEVVGYVVVVWHLGRQWLKNRRKKKAEMPAPTDPETAKTDKQRVEDDERFMRDAVFSHLELSQTIEQLQGDVKRCGLEILLITRDRDQWKTLAEERQQTCGELRADRTYWQEVAELHKATGLKPTREENLHKGEDVT